MTPYRDRLNAGHYTTAPADKEPTVAELQDQLRALDQPVSGTKAELVARLEEAQAEAD